MTFSAVWLALVAGSSGFVPLQLTEKETFPTRAACEQHVADVEARMADWVRGHLNAAFDVEVHVEGQCIVPGTPS